MNIMEAAKERLFMSSKTPRRIKMLIARGFRLEGDRGNSCRFASAKCGRNVTVRFHGTGNEVSICSRNRSGGRIEIEVHGNGNVIRIESLECRGVARIKCLGDGHRVNIAGLWVGETFELINGAALQGTSARESVCEIGRGVSAEGLRILNHNSHGVVRIGDDCMISHDVTLLNSDSHPIYELGKGEIVNRPTRPMTIGRHVWLGMKSSVLKGVSIPDGCIVGFGAVVSRSVTRESCAIAGNPAKVVKENVDWKQYDSVYF